jgi:hypothetical protein
MKCMTICICKKEVHDKKDILLGLVTLISLLECTFDDFFIKCMTICICKREVHDRKDILLGLVTLISLKECTIFS